MWPAACQTATSCITEAPVSTIRRFKDCGAALRFSLVRVVLKQCNLTLLMPLKHTLLYGYFEGLIQLILHAYIKQQLMGHSLWEMSN